MLGMTVVAGIGVAASLRELFLSRWMGLWRFLGSDWLQIGHHGSKSEYWGSLLVHPGCTLGWAWELLGTLWGSLGVNAGASGIQN